MGANANVAESWATVPEEALMAMEVQMLSGGFATEIKGLKLWEPLAAPDLAWRLAPHTDLVIETHMQPSGREELVQPSVGFYFGDRPPTRTPARPARTAWRGLPPTWKRCARCSLGPGGSRPGSAWVKWSGSSPRRPLASILRKSAAEWR